MITAVTGTLHEFTQCMNIVANTTFLTAILTVLLKKQYVYSVIQHLDAYPTKLKSQTATVYHEHIKFNAVWKTLQAA